jgi:fluoride exporter
MPAILLVGLGGAAGSILRYMVGIGVHRLVPATAFPYGILSVNLLGSFLIGLLGGLAETRALFSPATRLALFTGFLGGFTTFSTFTYDTFNMARGPAPLTAVLYVMAQVGLGLLAVYLGHLCSRWL